MGSRGAHHVDVTLENGWVTQQRVERGTGRFPKCSQKYCCCAVMTERPRRNDRPVGAVRLQTQVQPKCLLDECTATTRTPLLGKLIQNLCIRGDYTRQGHPSLRLAVPTPTGTGRLLPLEQTSRRSTRRTPMCFQLNGMQLDRVENDLPVGTRSGGVAGTLTQSQRTKFFIHCR